MRALVYLVLVLCCTASLYGGPRDDWRLLYFPSTVVTNAALESSIWGDAADPDHDGHNNLFEYATGLNPTNFDAASGLAFSSSNGMFSLAYNQRTNDNELFFKLDSSTNLLNWSVPPDWIQTNIPANLGFQLTTVKGLASPAAAYFRLRIAGSRPNAVPANLVLGEDRPTLIQLSASDPDAGTNALQFVITQLPQIGELFDGTNMDNPISLTNIQVADTQARILYNPATNGSYSLAFKVVRNWVESHEAIVNLKVDGAPVATGTNVSTVEDIGVYFALDGTDPDGDSLTSTIRLLPTNGKLYQVLDDDVTLGPVITATPTIVSNHHKRVYYLPNRDFFQLPVGDLVRFDVFDGAAFSNTITVIIAVASGNYPPIEAPVVNTGYIDQAIIGVDLNISDPDSDDWNVYITRLPAKGTLYFKGAISPQNQVTLTNNHAFGFPALNFQYVPNEPPTGPSTNYTFTYYVTELNPVTLSNYVSPTITNTVNVLLRSLPPTLQDCQTNASTPPNTPVDITLNGMDPDGDSSALVFTILGPPQHGTLAAQDIIGNFETITQYPFELPSSDPSFGWPVQYTPAPGFGAGSAKTDSFSFTVQDQSGLFAPGNPSVVITVGP